MSTVSALCRRREPAVMLFYLVLDGRRLEAECDDRRPRESDPRSPWMVGHGPAPVLRGTRCVADIVSPPSRVGRRQRPRLGRVPLRTRSRPVRLGVTSRGRAPVEQPPSNTSVTESGISQR